MLVRTRQRWLVLHALQMDKSIPQRQSIWMSKLPQVEHLYQEA